MTAACLGVAAADDDDDDDDDAGWIEDKTGRDPGMGMGWSM
jgi:hypothetical protein